MWSCVCFTGFDEARESWDSNESHFSSNRVRSRHAGDQNAVDMMKVNKFLNPKLYQPVDKTVFDLFEQLYQLNKTLLTLSTRLCLTFFNKFNRLKIFFSIRLCFAFLTTLSTRWCLSFFNNFINFINQTLFDLSFLNQQINFFLLLNQTVFTFFNNFINYQTEGI